MPAPLIESISKLSEKTKFAMKGTGTGRFDEKKTQKLNTNMIGGNKAWVRCCLIMFFFQHLSAITIASSIFGGKNESVCFDIFVNITMSHCFILEGPSLASLGISCFQIENNQNGYLHVLLRKHVFIRISGTH